MKKSILFVIDSLGCAGAEKSLVTLLSLLDYSKYEVDLQLFRYGGEFEQYLPKEVNLLPPLGYTCFLDKSLCTQVKNILKTRRFNYLMARIKYSLRLRAGKQTNITKARIYWQTVKSVISISERKYDYAIAYAQGVPTFYVVDKVIANKKYAWVNVGYRLKDREKMYQYDFYKLLDKIVLVSDSAIDVFQYVYPEFKEKMTVIWDILDYEFIKKLSQNGKSYVDGFLGNKIITVARLNQYQKGYDIALDACRILKNRGIHFRWYALGKGNFRQEMEQYIQEHNLEDYFILLGTTPNPYPYIKDATLYVQTSRHEGYGLSIAEARMLNIPVVTTEFDAVYNQMVNGKNGLVTSQEPKAVADAIERILTDRDLYNSIVYYLQNEKKGNAEEIQKFYRLLEA